MTTTPPRIYTIRDKPTLVPEAFSAFASAASISLGVASAPRSISAAVASVSRFALFSSVPCCAAALPGTPEPPEDMQHLTFRAANDIEMALLGAERSIHAMEKSWVYSGEIESGGVHYI